MSTIEKPQRPKFPLLWTIVFVLISVILPALILFFVPMGWPSLTEEVLMLCGILFLLGTILYCEFAFLPYKRAFEEYELSVNDFGAYKQQLIRRERMETFKANRKKEEASDHKECPNCGSEDIRPVFSSDRMLIGKSISYKVGMHFICNSCKYRW